MKNTKVYHHTEIDNDGKVYDYYCNKDKCGAYDLTTMEKRLFIVEKYTDPDVQRFELWDNDEEE